MWVWRDIRARERVVEKICETGVCVGDEEGGDVVVEWEAFMVARRWVVNAARRIPKIAPRVPPMLSTIGRREIRRVGTEPEIVVVRFVSSFDRMAGMR